MDPMWVVKALDRKPRVLRAEEHKRALEQGVEEARARALGMSVEMEDNVREYPEKDYESVQPHVSKKITRKIAKKQRKIRNNYV